MEETEYHKRARLEQPSAALALTSFKKQKLDSAPPLSPLADTTPEVHDAEQHALEVSLSLPLVPDVGPALVYSLAWPRFFFQTCAWRCRPGARRRACKSRGR